MSAALLGPYSAGDFHFTVTASANLLPTVRDALAPLSSDRSPSGTYQLVRTTPTTCSLSLDSEVLAADCAPQLALATLLWHVNQMLVEHSQEHLLLHAAGAALCGRMAVLAGPSGTGKSTLAAALLRRGFRYVTDEVVILDRQSLVARPYPRPLCLTSESQQALALAPDQATGSYLKSPVPWHDLGAPGVSAGVAPGIVVFPVFTAGAPTLWTGMTPGEAMMELAQHTFAFNRAPRETLESLARLAVSSRCGRLVFDSPAHAAEVVEGHLRVQHTPRAVSVDGPLVTHEPIGTVARLVGESIVYRAVDGSLHLVEGDARTGRAGPPMT